LTLVEKGLADERPMPIVPKGPKRPSKTRWLNEVVNQIREWRSTQKNVGRHDFLLPTNTQIKDLGFALPKSMAELQSLSVLRQWQLDMWGSEVLEIIERVTEID
jgi:hypothetical protein